MKYKLGSMLKARSKEEEFIREPTPTILSSKQFTSIWINWHKGFLSMGLEGKSSPIFIHEYKTENNPLSVEEGQFLYYSVYGTNVLWDVPFCMWDDYCEVHITYRHDFKRFWMLERSNTTYDLNFHLRAHRAAEINLKNSPTIDYPSVRYSNNLDLIGDKFD